GARIPAAEREAGPGARRGAPGPTLLESGYLPDALPGLTKNRFIWLGLSQPVTGPRMSPSQVTGLPGVAYVPTFLFVTRIPGGTTSRAFSCLPASMRSASWNVVFAACAPVATRPTILYPSQRLIDCIEFGMSGSTA